MQLKVAGQKTGCKANSAVLRSQRDSVETTISTSTASWSTQGSGTHQDRVDELEVLAGRVERLFAPVHDRRIVQRVDLFPVPILVCLVLRVLPDAGVNLARLGGSPAATRIG